jgi:hypothetical protein
MGNIFLNNVRIAGSAETRKRLLSAIEQSAIDDGQGYDCYKQFTLDPEQWAAAMPEWGTPPNLGLLESRYEDPLADCSLEQDDGRPARLDNDALLIKCQAYPGGLVDFFKRLGELFADAEGYVHSLEVGSGILDVWEYRDGTTVLIEHQMSTWLHYGISEWEKRDLVWKWTGERTPDIKMMSTFLSADAAEEAPAVTSGDVHSACQLAYETLAPAEGSLPDVANGYAYTLASSILKYRRAVRDIVDRMNRYEWDADDARECDDS